MLFNFDIEKVHISVWSSFLWSFLNVPFISNFIFVYSILYSLLVYSLFPSFKTSPSRDMIQYHFFVSGSMTNFVFNLIFQF